MSGHKRLTSLMSVRDTRTAGLIAFVGLGLVFLVLGLRPNIGSTLSLRTEISAEFPDSYKIQKFKSLVKLNGLPVGEVFDIDRPGGQRVVVKMRLDDGVRDLLGTQPSAAIEPVNVLGGRYSVDLKPGGDLNGHFNGTIPLARTTLPVELDHVLGALPKSAREGVQGTVRKLAPTLETSRGPLTDALASLPSFLQPAGVTLNAARGTRPAQDLPELTTNLESTARVLTEPKGQLEQISDDLNTTADVLARRTPELESVLHNLPGTMASARSGLADLSVTVDKLEVAAGKLQPTAPKLARLVKELDPTLDIALPVMRDLKPTLQEARPAVNELVPAAISGRSVLADLRGPVLDRLKGPISTFVLEPWRGDGTPGLGGLPTGYQRSHKFYEELAYMATNINRASMTQDSRGSTLAFQAGMGVESLTDGLPGSFPFTADGILKLALQQQGITNPSTVQKLLKTAGVK